MRKNVAGQVVSAHLIATADGSDVTGGTTTVYVTGDGGTQASGGTATHEGNGSWSFLPSQANTNYDHVIFTFVNASAISVDIQVYPVAFDPSDAVRMGLTALPNAAADAAGGLPISDAGALDLDALNTAAVRLTAARAQVLDDWINAGRLDAILDIIAADVVNIDGAAMRGTDSAYTGTPPTAAAIADAVWDEAQADHVSVGSFGEMATELASVLADTNELQSDDVPGLIAALNDPTAAAIADAVWDELQSAHVTVGSFGEIATEIASVLADTNELQTDDVPGLIAALNNVSAADVNAQMVDVLSTDVQALPGQGAPTATPTLTAALLYLYKAFRNKSEQTATTYSLYDDAGTTVDQKRTISDDGTTFTAEEVATGP